MITVSYSVSGAAGDDTAFEGDGGEGVQSGFPAQGPADFAAAGGVEGAGDQVEAFQGGMVGREMSSGP
jgi:hypothetical protein